MKLQECTIGTVVGRFYGPDLQEVGVIVGITNNCPSGDADTRRDPLRAIPLVQFSSEREPRGIHHNNLQIFKDKYLKES